jgi:molybdenum cofactor guanylyltransferase
LDVSCIILAGGRSRRLGRNKSTETIGGISLIETVVSRLMEFKSETIVVTAHDSILPRLSQYPAVKVVEDIYPGKGTLGGIYSGLVASATVQNIVVGCDMPFLNPGLFRYMIDNAAGFDSVVPRTRQGALEPLHALYSRCCIEPMDCMIKQNRLSVLDLYPLIKVRYIEASEISRYDLQNLSFFNINTEADLKTGRELANEKGLTDD